MNKKLIRKMQTAAGGPLFPWLLNTEYVDNWKFRTTPASKSRVLSGKGVETDKQYTERRKKETTKRTWRSDAADVAHGIGEGILALNPYTAIPYFGAKVGLDFLNGTYGWHTALNASVPLFHLAPQAVGLREATNVALEDAANAGSKTARNWRVAREIKLATKNKPNMEVPKPIIRTKVGDVEINNPGLYYHQSDAGKAKNFVSTGRMRTPLEESWLAKEEAGEHIPIKIRSGIVPGYPQDPGSAMFAQGNLWYGLTTNKPDLLVTAREMPIANKNASVMSNKASLRQLEAQGTRRVTNDNIYTQGPHNRQNTTAYTWVPRYGYKKVTQEPSTSLKFFERKPSKISEAERAGVPKGERNVKQGYLLKDAIEEANKFAEKWGYNKLSQNATLLDIENLYNQHNTFFRGVTTEQLENTRNRVAKELGINPELLTNDLYLLYVSTHPWPGNDRIWVTPFSHYGKIYGNSDMIGGKGLLSAVMRPWKTTKDIKQWPKLSLWTLGFKEDVSNPVITPWVSNAPDAIRSLGALSEFLVKSPLIYRGLGKDFKGTFLLYLKYKDNQGKLGWIESLVGELPLEIIIEKQGGKMNVIEQFKQGGSLQSTSKELKYNNYYGTMEKVAEQNYKNWGFPNTDYALLHALNDNTYNYRGYYNKYPNGKGNAVDHWTDEFKTVYHPTFSKESKYSGKKSLYNPKGIKGGSWLFGKFFIPSKDLLMEYFKKGGGIHIKEKNKGKFTSYCGGKVTDECIRKAKASGNPTLVKRATFALNSRRWAKHKNGGQIIQLFKIRRLLSNLIK